VTIDVDIRDTPDAAGVIEARLLADLRALLPQRDSVAVVLGAHDGDGRLIGGVTGGTSYGWLLVKVLWVDEAHRGRGIGARLLAAAEDRARALGCHAAWLDSSNPAAVDFYERRGYRAFGRLDNGPGREPATHSRVFLCKDL
jgi:GNAT superfamily N-acetyltransferase